MIEPRIDLPIDEMPRQWYNLAADLPQPPPPPLGPDGNPIGPEVLAPVFPMNLIEQEVTTERWIDIPEGILEIYARWRPSPLRRAYALEKHLGTPAKIYYKNESVSPAGSHKPNTAVAQAWYNKEFGIKRLTTETGAGQWGSRAGLCLPAARPRVRGLHGAGQLRPEALPQDDDGDLGRAAACRRPHQRPRPAARSSARCPTPPAASASPSARPSRRRSPTPRARPATRWAACSTTSCSTRRSSGSRPRSSSRRSAIKNPDVVIGCAGGGSNFAGLAFPFVADKINGAEIEIIPVEPEACPTLTQGALRLRPRRHRRR